MSPGVHHLPPYPPKTHHPQTHHCCPSIPANAFISESRNMASHGLARTTSSIFNTLRNAQCLSPTANLRSLEALRGRCCHLPRSPNETSEEPVLLPPSRRKSWVAEKKHLPLLDEAEKVRGQRSVCSADCATRLKKEETNEGKVDREGGVKAFINGGGVPITRAAVPSMERTLNTVLLFKHPSVFKPSTGARSMETTSADSTLRRTLLSGQPVIPETLNKRSTNGGPRGKVEINPPKNKESKKLKENTDTRAGSVTPPSTANVKRVMSPKHTLNPVTPLTTRRAKVKTCPKRNSKNEIVSKSNNKISGESTLLTKLFSPSAEVRHNIPPAIPPKPLQYLMNDRFTNVNEKNIDKGQSANNATNTHATVAHNFKLKPLQTTESKLFSNIPHQPNTKTKTQHTIHTMSSPTYNPKQVVKQPNSHSSRMSTKNTSEQIGTKLTAENQPTKKTARSTPTIRTKLSKVVKTNTLPIMPPGSPQVKKSVGTTKHRSRADTKERDPLKQHRLNNKAFTCTESKPKENQKFKNPSESTSKQELRSSKMAAPILPDVVKVKVAMLPRTISSESCVYNRKRSVSTMRYEAFHTEVPRRKKGKNVDEFDEDCKSASDDTKQQKLQRSRSAPSLNEEKTAGPAQKGAAKARSRKMEKGGTKKVKAQQMMNKMMAKGNSKGDATEEKSETTGDKKPSKLELVSRKYKAKVQKLKAKRGQKQERKSSTDMKKVEKKSSKKRRGSKHVRTKETSDECPPCPKLGCPTGEEKEIEIEEVEEPPIRRRGRERIGYQKTKRSSHKKLLSWLTWRKRKPEETCPDIEEIRKQLNIFDEEVIKISNKIYINKQDLPPPPCVHKYRHLEMESLRIKRSETCAYPKSTKCASAFLPVCAGGSQQPGDSKNERKRSEVMIKPQGSLSIPKMRSSSTTLQNTLLRESSSSDKIPDDTINSNISDLPSFPSIKSINTKSSQLVVCPPPPPTPLDSKLMVPEPEKIPPPARTTGGDSFDVRCHELIKIQCPPSAESLIGPKLTQRFPSAPRGDPCGPKRMEKPLKLTTSPLDHVCVHPLRPNVPIVKPSECRPPRQLAQIIEQEEEMAKQVAACKVAVTEEEQSDCIVGSKRRAKALCVPPKGVKGFTPWRRFFGLLMLLLLPILLFWKRKKKGKKETKVAAVAVPECVEDTSPPKPCILQPLPEHKPSPCSCKECTECRGREITAGGSATPPQTGAEAPASAAGGIPGSATRPETGAEAPPPGAGGIPGSSTRPETGAEAPPPGAGGIPGSATRPQTGTEAPPPGAGGIPGSSTRPQTGAEAPAPTAGGIPGNATPPQTGTGAPAAASGEHAPAPQPVLFPSTGLGGNPTPTPVPTPGQPGGGIVPSLAVGPSSTDGFTTISEDLYLAEPPTISDPIINYDSDAMCLRIPKHVAGKDPPRPPKSPRPPQSSDPIAPNTLHPNNPPSNPPSPIPSPYNSTQHHPQQPSPPPPVPPQPPISVPYPTPSPPPPSTSSEVPAFQDDDSSLTEADNMNPNNWAEKKHEFAKNFESDVEPRLTISLHYIRDILRESVTADAWKRYKKHDAFQHGWVPGWGAGEEGLELVTRPDEAPQYVEDDETFVSSLVFTEDDPFEPSFAYTKDASLPYDDVPITNQLSTDSLNIMSDKEISFEIADIPVWVDF